MLSIHAISPMADNSEISSVADIEQRNEELEV